MIKFTNCLFLSLFFISSLLPVAGDEKVAIQIADSLIPEQVKQFDMENALDMLLASIKNLYKIYDDGGRSNENLKNEIARLTASYIAMKRIYGQQ